MANGDDMAQLTSLMDSTAMGPDSFEEEMEIDIEIAAPGTFVGKVNEVLPEGIEIEPQEDGGVVIDLDPQKMMGIDEGDFYRNLAEELDDRELSSLSSQLLADFESNKASRSEWEDAYSKGLGLLGYTYEERTMPFRGATGVTHPLLAEAATQFQAQAFNEPLAGSTFKKVYYDEAMDRAVSRFVPAEDIVVPYGASDLDSCENITQVVKMTLNDLRIRQVMGFYRDIPVIPSQSNDGEVIDEMSKLEGMEPGNLDYD